MPDGLSVNLWNGQKTSALAFFGIFKTPITSIEAWRWHHCPDGQSVRFTEILGCLDGRCRSRYGLFRLPKSGPGNRGAEPEIELRWRRYRLAEGKFRRAVRFARLARLLPSVRLVAVGNSLAWSSAEGDSDIDMFVVAAPGTVWLTRFVLGSALALTGLRPTPTVQKDRICLSFLVSQDSLDLSGLRTGKDDVYLTYWLAGLVPLYDAGGVMSGLWAANWRLRSALPSAGSRAAWLGGVGWNGRSATVWVRNSCPSCGFSSLVRPVFSSGCSRRPSGTWPTAIPGSSSTAES